jgi:dissimilatory sulfite reductase (desulfoviridin) alpha/beta subunit
MPRKAYRLKLCWGVESRECPNVLDPDASLKQKLESVLESSGWPECLAGALSREIKPLDQFSISVSGCPNGCSRPQIADFGLLQAQYPEVDAGKCTGCGECERACREGAIDLETGVARINPGLCLSCGVCIRTCPEQALFPARQGYRVQVGGKLGRHPRLAEELQGIYSREEMLAILKRCLALYQKHYRPRVRFGQVVAEQGADKIQQMLSR